MDKELKEYLDSYTVQPPGEALLERVVTQVQKDLLNVMPLMPRTAYPSPLMRAAMIAAIAVIGFSTGLLSSSPQQAQLLAYQQDTAGSNDSSNVYRMIVNPQNLEEMML